MNYSLTLETKIKRLKIKSEKYGHIINFLNEKLDRVDNREKFKAAREERKRLINRVVDINAKIEQLRDLNHDMKELSKR